MLFQVIGSNPKALNSNFCEVITQEFYYENFTLSRAYFSVQYYTLCAVLILKCAVLISKMCRT